MNDLYRSSGTQATDVVFPYDAERFDHAIVISVFTHMLRDELAHYLSEIHRVLNTDGVVFATFFILNDESRDRMSRQAFRFDHRGEGCYLMDRKVKAANVAYDESDLITLLADKGFIVRTCLYGSWSGRTGHTIDFQDIMVLEKIT
jgi:SAM-dependent methyltransferase